MWKDLDHDGTALSGGDDTWKLLQNPRPNATYLMSLGSNLSPDFARRTGCGPGNHIASFGIAVDETGIYVSAQTKVSIETCMLKMTPDAATRLWTAILPGRKALEMLPCALLVCSKQGFTRGWRNENSGISRPATRLIPASRYRRTESPVSRVGRAL